PSPRPLRPPAYCALRALHSFPTRRSSDLGDRAELGAVRGALVLAHPELVDLRAGIHEGRMHRETGDRLVGNHPVALAGVGARREDRKSTRLNSSHVKISYAVFCLKKKRAG